MAIVTITVPANIQSVAYGQANMLPDASHQLKVPDYVAKTLLTLAGASGPTLTSSAATLLAGAGQDFEANYLFAAYGQELPAVGRIAAASALMTARGEPIVSLG